MSHDIQNEILNILAHSILREIVKEVRECDFFSLMLDETLDSGRLEQVSICCWIVSKKLIVKEYFWRFYNNKSTTAEELLNVVKDVFLRLELDFSKLRGQCYDKASTMSGRKKGLQSKILKIEERALYVHCNAHNLNLVIQDAITQVQWARQYIGITREILTFIQGSPKRMMEFKDYKTQSLIPYCPTRYAFLLR